MKWALFFVVGIGAFGALLGYWFWSLGTTRDEVRSYCNVTRRGQIWAEAKDRAESRGFEIMRYGGNDQLVFAQAIDRRFGCVVVMDKSGMVLETRFAELPGK